MAVFVDFEEDEDESQNLKSLLAQQRCHTDTAKLDLDTPAVSNDASVFGSRVGIKQIGFPRALACYPVALSLASHLDLTDLAALSSTCRSIHDSLKQFSHQLVTHSLRCIHDREPLLVDVLVDMYHNLNTRDAADPTPTGARAALPVGHAEMAAAVHEWPQPGQGLFASVPYKSKLRACARDLVSPCRRCGITICRNCATKPPSYNCIRDRYRRLCRACLEAPLSAHLKSLTDSVDGHEWPLPSSSSSTRSARSTSSSSNSSSDVHIETTQPQNEDVFTSTAFEREACTCVTRGVFLCGPCGNNLRATDTTYKRVWTWRSRYSTHIGGGLGTGLGVGNQGQKCGRGQFCLESGGSAVCWVEIDCSEGHGPDHGRDNYDLVVSGSRTVAPIGERPGPADLSNKPGYLSQEIEGIGGVVKKKVKKRVKVGATVWEYEDERASGKYLEREASERERSWCGWCDRVCLGENDRLLMEN